MTAMFNLSLAFRACRNAGAATVAAAAPKKVRREMRRRDAGNLARPSAGCQNDDVCGIAAIIRHDGTSSAAANFDLLNRTVLVQRGAGPLRSFGERATEQAVIDLMISRAQHRPGDAGSQMRLAAASFRPR